MRVLVTGGSGFIGSHLVEYHLAKGDEVLAIDDLSTGKIENIKPFQQNPTFHFEHADIVTWPDLKKWVIWADRIYHMAAVLGVYRVLAEPQKVIATNVSGCERLISVTSESKSRAQIIIASTSSVYGHSEKHLLNEKDNLIIEPADPLSIYAVSKIADEVLSVAYYKKEKTPIILMRFFNTVGPRQTGQYGMVVPRFVNQACQNKPITVFGDGTQIRSFCDVRDTIAMVNLLAETPKSMGEIINVGNDYGISINELAHLVRKRANSNSEIQHIPYEQAYGQEFSDIKHRCPDLSKVKQLTGYKHKWTLEQTIDDLIRRQNYLLI